MTNKDLYSEFGVPWQPEVEEVGWMRANGLFFDSTYGGRFPGAQRHTGFDPIALVGAAAEPVYVVVEESGATLKPAKDLWGKRTLEAAQAILGREGQDSDVISIGPAGEHRVRFASLAHYWKNREGIAARGGLAAVLGSKNSQGARGPRQAEGGVCGAGGAEGPRSGDAGGSEEGDVQPAHLRDAQPGEEHQHHGRPGVFQQSDGVLAGREQVGAERYREEFRQKDTTCNKYSVACGKTFEVKAGEYAGTAWKMTEYESI